MGAITEVQLVEIKCVPENPVFLRWINKHGGLEHWCFGINQVYKLNTKDGDLVRVNFTDYENQSVISKLIKREAVREIELTAFDVTVNQVKGLESLYRSNFIQILYENGDPPIWQNVRVKAGSKDSYNTGNQVFNFDCTIVLPEIFVQVN